VAEMTCAMWASRSLVACAALVLVCCTKADTWPKAVQLAVVDARQAFEQNWEVKIRLSNDGDSDFIMDRLADADAQLVLSDGATRSLHSVSVGRKKSVTVTAHSTKSTSLLFQSSKAKPVALQLKGRTFPIQIP